MEDLTAKGWDQAKFQKILNWYQDITTRLTSSSSATASYSSSEDAFPNGFLHYHNANCVSLVTNVSEAAAEYKKRVEELTAKGWDQAKFQKILDWYQNTTTRLTSSPSTASVVTASSEDTFPNGISHQTNNFINFFSLVTNVNDAAEEYKKRVEDLTAKGWDQAKFQKILDWYQDTTKKLVSNVVASVNDAEDTFPNGI